MLLEVSDAQTRLTNLAISGLNFNRNLLILLYLKQNMLSNYCDIVNKMSVRQPQKQGYLNYANITNIKWVEK